MTMSKTQQDPQMVLRAGREEDSQILGEICYNAFRAIADQHNFPHDFPSAEAGIGLISMLLSRHDAYSVVAEDASGKLLGSNFLWVGDTVAGVGPITVDPEAQNAKIGRSLMEDVIRYADDSGFPSVRLVQSAYHNRSLSLYTKLGFDTVEPLSCMQGSPVKVTIEGRDVRTMTVDDIEAADALCFRVHGHNRHADVASAVEQGSATLVENGG